MVPIFGTFGQNAGQDGQAGTIAGIAKVTTQTVHEFTPDTPLDMEQSASQAAGFLKSLAHEGRLMILCHLGSGEKSVGQLEEIMHMRQAAVSQLLARLREDELVAARREGKTVYYRISDPNVLAVIGLLHSIYCPV